jgi:hypothetical protein
VFRLLKVAARGVDAVPCLASGRENAPGGAATPHKEHAAQQSHPSWHPAPPDVGSLLTENALGSRGGSSTLGP